ncbi:MAG: NAD-dependent deacylase [Synergistales bacterium]|nr:NAD-dependent deacylase [Synergistales bacterium]
MGKYEAFAQMIRGSCNLVVFTGAGMSTESGLPDFRSDQGIWKGADPSQLASVEAMERGEEEFFEFYRTRIRALLGVSPNEGHMILVDWEKKRILKGIITQNVDGLHQRAGSKRVAELHGNLREVSCRKCRSIFPNTLFLEGEKCPHCGGNLRPSVVLFGEMLPMRALQEAQDMADECDLFVVLGSSLQVSPANWFPREARSRGAGLVIVNIMETPLDAMADLLFHEPIGQVLKGVDEYLN